MANSIYRTLRVLSYREKRLRKQNFPKFSSTVTGKVQLVSFGLFLLSSLSAFGYYFSQNEVFKLVSLNMLALAYVIYIIHPFVAIFENRNRIIRFIDNPLITYFESAEQTSEIRERYLRYLFRQPLRKLKLVLNQLKEEKTDLEQRISLLVGSIDKIGLTPGLLALAASWDKIENIKYDWVLGIAYTVPLLYVFAIFTRLIVSKLQSHISLLELAIEEKEST